MVSTSELVAQYGEEDVVSVYDQNTNQSITIPRERQWEYEDAMHWLPVDIDHENLISAGEEALNG